MRIASLVPSATESLFALGLGDRVVAVTHECNYPPEAATLPHLTRTVVPDGLSAAEIDAEVRRITAAGQPLYLLDSEMLESLDVDLIVTQEVCQVCAVSYDDVMTVAAGLPSRPEVISLDPSTFGEVLGDLERLAEAADEPEAGSALIDSLEERLARIQAAVADRPSPSVICLEWLSPPFSAGHWIPEVASAAGGHELLGTSGAKSHETSWDAVADAAPEHLLLMPCGWDIPRALQEVDENADRLGALSSASITALDAEASFSRPGPRLVDGVETLAHVFHPHAVPDAGPIAAAQV